MFQQQLLEIEKDAVLVSGFWFLVSGFWFLVSGFWFLVSGFWFLVSGFWFLVSGFWFLVSGFWFLVSGFWFLVSGFWFLAAGREMNLDGTDLLVYLKCKSALAGFTFDLHRLKEDIRTTYSQPKKGYEEAIFVPEAANKQLRIPFVVQVKTFLESAFKVYVKGESRFILGC